MFVDSVGDGGFQFGVHHQRGDEQVVTVSALLTLTALGRWPICRNTKCPVLQLKNMQTSTSLKLLVFL